MLDEIVLHHPLYLPAVDGVEGVACLAKTDMFGFIFAVQHLEHSSHKELATEKITEIIHVRFEGFIAVLTPFLHYLTRSTGKFAS